MRRATVFSLTRVDPATDILRMMVVRSTMLGGIAPWFFVW